MGSGPLRSGVLAADADISDQPIALAARPDGVVAFQTGDRVFWVQDGRLQRIRVPLRGIPEVTLAFASDGALLVGACPEYEPGTAAVFRVAPGVPATVIAGIPGRRGTSGDGGPATAARLRCAGSLSVEADGAVLIADSIASGIRRVDPHGI